jgi:hypothetical protein
MKTSDANNEGRTMKKEIATLATSVLGLTALGSYGLALTLAVVGLVLARLIIQEPKRRADQERRLRAEIAKTWTN